MADTVMLPAGVDANAFADSVQKASQEVSPVDPPDPLIDTRRGHFLIETCLGRGGMGAVYQALDESLQRYVALKVIRPDRTASNDGSHFHRLVQEARAQARVNHPNVVQIYFVGLDESAPYLAMELIRGPNLAQRLQAGPIAFADVVDIALQLTSALERAAQFDIVHGDIKPGNIMVVEGTTVKVADFGLARSVSNGEVRGISGSPKYLSPEAARREPLDRRSDMYSLGVTLFELTFGRLPYENPSGLIQTQILAHLEQPPKFPEPWPAELPERWRDILQTLLAKDPADRYSEYAELRQALLDVRPVANTSAAVVPRALAWMFDLLSTLLLQFVVSVPLWLAQALKWIPSTPSVNFVVSVTNGTLALIVLLLVCWLQSASASPGKSLFQLKVVDPHGLPPTRWVRWMRVFLQLPFCLVETLSSYTQAVGLGEFGGLLLGLASLYVLVNAGFILFDSERRGLHDRLLRTRVVIDAR